MTRTSKTHFDLSPGEYEQSRGGHLGERRRDLVRGVVAECASPGALVIEVGCGPGGQLAELAARHPDSEFLGLDVEPRMIEHARDTHTASNVRYEVVDLGTETMEVTADIAYSIDVLHHVRDLPHFLTGLRGILRPGATWLAIEPNLYHPFIFWSQGRMRRAGLDEDHF